MIKANVSNKSLKMLVATSLLLTFEFDMQIGKYSFDVTANQ